MTIAPHADTLSRILARTFRLYVQVHGYHWNVEGPEFRQLHGFFEEQYQALWESLDEIAERLRALGAYAPGSMAGMLALAGEDPARAIRNRHGGRADRGA